MKIATLPGAGTLAANGMAVTAGQSVSAADIAAGRLEYTPTADAGGAGYAAFTFQVQDDGGSANGGADLDPTPRRLAIDVTAVNDAPTGRSATLALVEDVPYAFRIADFGFADPHDTPADALLSVTIASLPGAGSLSFDGRPVAVGTVVGAADLAAGKLVFVGARDASGAGYASFGFRVRDDGGTAQGGVDADPVMRTLTLDLAAVNDAPRITSLGGGASAALSVAENSTAVATVTATDTEGDPIAYSIAGGADAARFAIDAQTGVLRFLAAPNFEAPADADADNVYEVVVRATDSAGAFGSQAIAVGVTDESGVATVASGTLWFSTGGDVTGPAGGTTWNAGQIAQFGDAGDRYTLNGGATGGTIALLPGYASPVPLRGLHYMQSAITIGSTPGATFDLNAGDLVLVLDPGSALSTVTLDGTTFDAGDIAVFRPTTPGDYASGTYRMLLDDGVHAAAMSYDINALTLVERDTMVGGTLLSAGTFLVGHSGATDSMNVYAFTASGTGIGAATQTSDSRLMLAGAALGNPDSAVRGLHLLTAETAFNDDTLPAGTLLIAVDGSNAAFAGLSQTPYDIVALSIGRTLLDSVAPGTAATGTMLFRGSDVGLTTGTAIGSLTVISAPPANTPPTITSPASATLPENTTAVQTLAATDPDGQLPTFSIVGGADAARFTIDASNRLAFVTAPDFETPGDADGDNVYLLQIRADDGAGGFADQWLAITVTDADEAPTAVADSYALAEDGTLLVGPALGLLANDADPEHSSLSALLVRAPANGVLALDADGGFRYTPNAGFSGSDAFTYRAFDGSLYSAPVTVSITVGSVNDAPVGTDATLTLLQNRTHVFAAGDFGYSDPGDAPPNALAAVQLSSLPTVGALTLDGAAVNSGQWISAADLAAGRLAYAPAADGSGLGYASLGFRVRDDGGTADGGVDTDTVERTLGFDVLRVNRAPQGTAGSVAALEDTPYVFALADFGFSDAADSPADALLAVKIATLPGAGTLAANGMAVTAGQSVSAADIAAGRLEYTPTADAGGAGYAAFTFQVQDDGGSANGGADLDPTPRRLAIDVTAVNDAPTGRSATLALVEDVPYAFRIADFGFADPHDTPADALLSVTIASLPGAGSLSFDGRPVAVGTVVGAADLAAGKLVFVGARDASGAGYASFGFRVRDDGGTAQGGVDADPVMRTLTLDLAAVNDAPRITSLGGGASAALSVAENSTAVATVTATDTEGDPIAYSIAGGADAARFAIDAQTGVLRFLAAPNFEAPADADADNVYEVVVRATDSAGAFGSQAIAVGVTDVDEAPQAAGDSYRADEGTTLVVGRADGVLANDADPESRRLAARLVSGPAHGILTLAADGGFSYTPGAGFRGVDSFSYRAGDGRLDSAVALVSITVTAVNHRPAAAADAASGDQDTVIAGNVLANDTDPDGDALAASLVDGPAHGSLRLAADGAFAYVPEAGFVGADSFSYRAGDGRLESTATTVTLTVRAVAAAPAPGDAGTGTPPPPQNGGTGAVNHAPTMAGGDAAAATIVEPGAAAGDLVASGTIDFDDADGDDVHSVSALAEPVGSTLGSLTVTKLADTLLRSDGGTAAGQLVWTYTVKASAIDDLAAGETRVERYTVTVDDGRGGSAARQVEVTLVGTNDAPVVVAALASQTQSPEVAFRFALPKPTFTDPDGTDTLRYAASLADGQPLPAWLRFDADQQVFTGASPAGYAGSVLVRITAVDPSGAGAVAFLRIDIAPPVEPMAPGAAIAARPPAGAVPETPAVPAAAPVAPVAPATVPPRAVAVLPAQHGAVGDLLADGDSLSMRPASPLVVTAPRAFDGDARPSTGHASSADLVLAQGTYADFGAIELSPLLRTLQSDDMLRRLAEFQQQIEQQTGRHQGAIASSIALTTGVSVGYIVWLVRGGVLVSSMLSAMPAWQMIDPLPVLMSSRRGAAGRNDDEEGADDVERLFDRRRADPAGDRAGTPAVPPVPPGAAPTPASAGIGAVGR